MISITCDQRIIPPSNRNIQYFGRVDRSKPHRILFDWPGVAIQAVFEGSKCDVILEGGPAYFDVFIDNTPAGVIKSPQKERFIALATGLADTKHIVCLLKRSESIIAPVSFGGFALEAGKHLARPPEPPERKLLYIGDSYTAGFANEYQGRECDPLKADSIILATTNTNKAFGPLVAQAFGAQYQILAISGKGLVKNFSGIDPGKELPAYLDRTLLTSINTPGTYLRWDPASWKADVAFIAIGINDFQADPPYADTAIFDRAYCSLIETLRKNHPGVKFICCATRIWPIDALIPRIKAIVQKQQSAGKTDVSYFEFASENNALFGHPSLSDHRAIADSLISLVERTAGWKVRR
jgi:hypothetical protein